MWTKRTVAAKRLPLTIGFAVLLLAAFGAGCKGFFPDPVLQSIAIQPPSPQILLGKTQNLQAWGTYDDGTRQQITSGLSWGSDDGTIVSVDANGVATGEGLGTTGITAAAQGLSGSATATVFIVISSLTVNPTTWGFLGTQGASQNFTATANGNQDVTSTATFTPSNTTFFSCPGGTTPVTCTADPGTTAGPYTITVSYPGSTLTATVNVTVN